MTTQKKKNDTARDQEKKIDRTERTNKKQHIFKREVSGWTNETIEIAQEAKDSNGKERNRRNTARETKLRAVWKIEGSGNEIAGCGPMLVRNGIRGLKETWQCIPY